MYKEICYQYVPKLVIRVCIRERLLRLIDSQINLVPFDRKSRPRFQLDMEGGHSRVCVTVDSIPH